MSELLDPLVLEPGTYSIKAGISRNNFPEIIFQNSIGKCNGIDLILNHLKNITKY